MTEIALAQHTGSAATHYRAHDPDRSLRDGDWSWWCLHAAIARTLAAALDILTRWVHVSAVFDDDYPLTVTDPTDTR